MSLGVTVASVGAASSAALAQPGPAPDLLPPGAQTLKALKDRLARAPRRRDFRTVPMILEDPMLWDHEILAELLAYAPAHKQIWDNTDLAGSWLNGMRNSLNVQIWSFKHPDFLIVSATHGPAQLALMDQAMWDKYQLATLTKGAYAANTLIQRNAAAEADRKPESDTGAYSGSDNSVAALMDRGVVFMACHLALWELSARLIKQGVNPDRLSHEAMVAEMTNHLVPGVVLTPGMVATIPEFQHAGYRYIA
jgi:intracellular sulfur oxidation DsrE/DsrF family protein